MPKLDLQTATGIKVSEGRALAIKGFGMPDVLWGSIPIDPATLFTSNTGTWLEVSNNTVFESTLDLIPAGTDVGVGFFLDKSANASYSANTFSGLGSELVVNGTFDTDISGWVTASAATLTWDNVNQRMQIYAPTSLDGTSKSIPGLTIGKHYLVSLDLDTAEPLAETIRINFGAITVDNVVPSGTVKFVNKATSTSQTLSVRSNSLRGTFYLDNVSVRELLGNHAEQLTASFRPLLKQTGSLQYLQDDTIDDSLTWEAPTANYTVAYANSLGFATILTNQALSGTTDILVVPDLVAYIAVDKELTPTEQAGLKSYLESL